MLREELRYLSMVKSDKKYVFVHELNDKCSGELAFANFLATFENADKELLEALNFLRYGQKTIIEIEVINLIRLKSLKVINPQLFSVIAEKYVEFLALLKEFELKSFSEIKEVPSVKKYLKIEEQEGLIFNSSEDYDEKYDDFSD